MGEVALLLSPHLDDAVLSCPGTVQRLIAGGYRVVIATVFSEGNSTVTALYRTRRTEDRQAVRILGASEVHLQFWDAPYRSPAYSDFAAITFSRPREYTVTLREVRDRIRTLIWELRPGIVIAPLAVGNHVDHRLVRDAALSSEDATRLSFYEDRPYAFVREQVAHVLGSSLGSRGPGFWNGYFRTTYVRSYLGEVETEAVMEGWAKAPPFPRWYELQTEIVTKLDEGELTKALTAIRAYRSQLPDLFANDDELRHLYAVSVETLYRLAPT